MFEVPDDEIIDNDDEEEKFAFVEVGDLIDWFIDVHLHKSTWKADQSAAGCYLAVIT